MEEKPTTKQLLETPQYFDDNIDDVLVRDTITLSKIYERCNVVVFESVEFKKAEKDDKWINSNARFLWRSIHPAIKESQPELVLACKIGKSRGQGTMLVSMMLSWL
ncbi:hypothetical protein Godav_012093 [Gossypium davidsonii]|uniref:Uncharacterized protein n=2 Tax=Gossypium TaxID=3633 RepID=A0A7J8RC93_GOSDV|nr:hypothetical protein [Gossypium davidsonii]MBA0646524.1 hypothetical protein [Gossypium klotzschianum]